MSAKKIHYSTIIMVACFITGNLVGAGILGLPIKTGISGFVPSLVGMVMVSFAMFFTALVLGNESLRIRQPESHYPSLYQEYLGPVGKWVATIANMIVLYGLLIAYLTGATMILSDVLKLHIPEQLIMVCFFLFLTLVTIANPKFLLRFSTLLVTILLISFVVIVIMGEKYVDPSHYSYANWGMLPTTLPIIAMATFFHNVIPSMSRRLAWNKGSLVMAIIFGSVVGFLMNVIWTQVGIGVLPMEGKWGILEALKNDLPATVPLAEAIKNPLFLKLSLAFAIIAIMTSYLSMGKALMDFMEDFTINYIKIKNRLLTILLTFLPPIIISVLFPDIFLKALDFVGGVGVVILFGIFPTIIALIRTKSNMRKIFLIVPILLLFIAILLFEIFQVMGKSELKVDHKYWSRYKRLHSNNASDSSRK